MSPCVKGSPDLHGVWRGEKTISLVALVVARDGGRAGARGLAAAGCRAIARAARRPPNAVDRQPRHARRPLRRAAGGLRLVRGAGARRRRWSSPTRSRRRSAIPRTRATASTSARAWRPSARSRGGRCRAACCRPSRSSAASSSGATPPTAPRRSCRGGSPTRPAAASRAPRSASGSRARRSLDEVSGKDGSFHLRLRAGPVDATRCASATPRWRPRSPTSASSAAGTTDAQLPPGARERDPRARDRQQGRRRSAA